MSEPAERVVIDRHDAAALPAHDPNCAAGTGDYDHEAHIGEPVDQHPEVAAELARLDASGGQVS